MTLIEYETRERCPFEFDACGGQCQREIGHPGPHECSACDNVEWERDNDQTETSLL